MQTVALARHAMATRFEIVLYGENEAVLRSAAEEALDEIERLDAQLSLYRSDSEISRINARAAAEPVRVEPTLFRLLRHAQQLSDETGGAFDITVAPLMRCWGFMRGTGQMPDPEVLTEARSRVGMQHVVLNQEDFTVRFVRDGMMLDLGSIGKGFALERAAELVKEAGVQSGILHGGTSTVYAVGIPPDAAGWRVGVSHPSSADPKLFAPGAQAGSSSGDSLLAVVPLKDEAMSVSAVWGKAFEANGRVYGHVIDPRKGEPVEGAVMAVVVLPSATESDALSTALLTLGLAGHGQIMRMRPEMRTLVTSRGVAPGTAHVAASGIEVNEARLAKLNRCGPEGLAAS